MSKFEYAVVVVCSLFVGFLGTILARSVDPASLERRVDTPVVKPECDGRCGARPAAPKPFRVQCPVCRTTLSVSNPESGQSIGSVLPVK